MTTWNPILLAFQLWQYVLARILAPDPPPPGKQLHRPRIAVIGAGLTGVAAASHCVGHGFDTVIFEAGPPENLGGIWSRVNNTSGLQIHSVMYRFFPTVFWNKGYPSRKEIVSQVEKVWQQYNLESRTRFNTRVTSIQPDGHGRYYINNKSNGTFDGVVAAIGSCGDPKMAHLPNMESFKGDIYHSSELDGKDVEDKDVLIVGGGASAIEALEFVAHSGNAHKVKILARSEKWIIPRNPVVDMLLALNIFGQETIFSWIPERLLKLFFYRDLTDMAPPEGQGLFTETPMVNNQVLNQIRSGVAEWLRGDIVRVEPDGIRFNRRAKGVPKGGPGHQTVEKGSVIIMATGYQRPSLDFLPKDCFEDEDYMPPNWYLQTFPPAHLSICCNNCTYLNAIGTVGNFHIGIYTRILLMFLIDPLTRPSEFWMKKWIDMTRFVKGRSPTGAFDFFTYSELIWWFLFCVTINPFRWKWAIFVFTGIGLRLPLAVVGKEDEFRNGTGQDDKKTTTY